MPLAPRISVDDVVRRVASSRRYRSVAEDVVRRLALAETEKARNVADAEKRTKRRLHQIFGAYYSSGTGTGEFIARLQTVGSDLDEPGLRALCLEALSRHASTSERVEYVEEYYGRVFAVTGRPSVLLDLACGLNPLSLPWMGLSSEATYLALDIDSELIALVNAFLDRVAVPHVARVQDIIAYPPAEDADVALLLKSLPCLEHQETGAGARLLRAVHARHVVVSYPTRSLSGRGKGMARTYRAQFSELVSGEPWTVDEIEFTGELVFIVGRAGQ